MKKVLLGILIGILLCGTGFGVYYYFFKEEAKEEEKVETEEVKTETLDVNSELVANLFDSVNLFDSPNVGGSGYYYAYYDKYDELDTKDFPDDLKIYLGIKKLMKVQGSYEKYVNSMDKCITGQGLVISADEVETSVKSIFGSDVKYKDTNLQEAYSCSYSKFQYDESSDNYGQCELQCGGVLIPSYISNIVSAIKKDSVLELTVSFGWVRFTNDNGKTTAIIYENEEEKNQLDSVEIDDNNIDTTEIADKVGDKFIKTYKYIFELNEDGNYYFKKVEKVK